MGRGNNGSQMRVPNSVVRIELISFFHNHPKLVLTCEEIVKNLRFREEQVVEQIDHLVNLRILHKENVDGATIYRYIPPYSNGAVKERRFRNINGFRYKFSMVKNSRIFSN
jgi:hypothetical protein